MLFSFGNSCFTFAFGWKTSFIFTKLWQTKPLRSCYQPRPVKVAQRSHGEHAHWLCFYLFIFFYYFFGVFFFLVRTRFHVLVKKGQETQKRDMKFHITLIALFSLHFVVLCIVVQDFHGVVF
jgi:hypothetical protein